MKNYEGKKFYISNSKMVKNYDIWQYDDYKEKKDFQMTRGYKEYLREKKRKEREEYLVCLRDKLNYQMKKYGEVDELDYQEFIRLVNGK
jgi:oligoribonuclease NrnB/cAMP/cGMP phosphodiesterase (DHH superfamily)